MIVQSKTIALVVISFLLVILIYSSVTEVDIFARPPKGLTFSCVKSAATIAGAAYSETCCQFLNGKALICNRCNFDANDNFVGDCENFHPKTPTSPEPPSTGTLLPPSGNNTGGMTNGQTGLPGRSGTTSALPGNSSTSTPPPGSIFKVPPGTTNTQPTGNNTGALPALTITKEHNPASPNVFSSVGNATNPSNNTGSTGSAIGLTGQLHHHKGSNVGQAETNNGNSPTPPPCPDKGPIPPNCTMKPVIK